MATTLTVQADMAAPTLAAADAAGNDFDNGTGVVYLFVKNASGGAITVTIAEQRTCNFGHAAQNQTATVVDGETSVLGPFDILRFNTRSKKVDVTYSSATSITVAAVAG
jgi:hypothetical protein